jgi:uncharacterized membrane protein
MAEPRRGRRRFIGWLAGVLAIAAATHVAAIQAYPRLVMGTAWNRLSEAAGPDGLIHAPRPDAASRTVVRPSPDLLYSVCVYDLEAGPWSVKTAIPKTYMSVSLYAMNTDNFFTINDQQIDSGELRFIIVDGPVDDVRTTGRPLIVRSPTTRGIALFRYFAGGDVSDAAQIDSARRGLECGRAPQPAELGPSPRARSVSGD